MQRSILFTALAGLCAAALADDGTGTLDTTAQVQVAFETIDRNSDQRISKTEAGTHKTLIDRFAAVDADGDGFISKAEFEARPGGKSFQ